MPDGHGREGAGKAPMSPAGERRAAMAADRRAQHARIAPLLATLPWRRIMAGYARVRDIADFMSFYHMYVPLLAEGEGVLTVARDSGHYTCFDLRASAGGVVVTAIDGEGNAKIIFETRKDYWAGESPAGPPLFTPL